MQIEAAEARRIERGPGQDEAIGDDHGRVGAEGGEGRLLGFALEALRRADGDGVRFGKDMDGRFLVGHAAARRAGWLRIDGERRGARRR